MEKRIKNNNKLTFDKKNHIIKLINANKKDVDINTIIDYLDYVNKVRYEKDDIEKILKALIIENKIILKNNFYFPRSGES